MAILIQLAATSSRVKEATPVVTCDHCGLRIADANDGILTWDEQSADIKMYHTACQEAAGVDPAEHHQSIGELPALLAFSMGLHLSGSVNLVDDRVRCRVCYGLMVDGTQMF